MEWSFFLPPFQTTLRMSHVVSAVTRLVFVTTSRFLHFCLLPVYSLDQNLASLLHYHVREFMVKNLITALRQKQSFTSNFRKDHPPKPLCDSVSIRLFKPSAGNHTGAVCIQQRHCLKFIDKNNVHTERVSWMDAMCQPRGEWIQFRSSE